jgi:hypothetical protein
MDVFGAEFEREHKPVVFTKNVVVTNLERGFELQPTDIIPISPASSEYAREALSAQLAANVASPQRAEFARDFSSPSLGYAPSQSVFVQNPEFGWELQPITNIIPVEPEFGFDVDLVRLTQFSGDIGAPEFDFEVEQVAISQSATVQTDPGEFDSEIQSVSISNNLVAGVVEFEREFGSAQITKVVFGESSEYDHESEGPEVTQFLAAPGDNHYDSEWGTPGLVQDYSQTVESAEFDHEMRSVRFPISQGIDGDPAEFGWNCEPVALRAFRRRLNTPRERVKHVRQD